TYALFQLGWCKLMTGSIDEATPLAEQLIRLSPRDPTISNWYSRIGYVHLLQSHFDDAVLWLEKAVNTNPKSPIFHLLLSSAYALNEETERAFVELAQARRLSPDDRYSSIARLKAVVGYWGVPKVRALHEATVF